MRGFANGFTFITTKPDIAQRFEIVLHHTNLAQSTPKDANFFRDTLEKKLSLGMMKIKVTEKKN